MPNDIRQKESFKYSKGDMKNNPAVLGILEGPIADIQNPTRNGRKYPEELWEKVFNSDIVNEQLDNGGIFGEAQHPVDRTETDPEKIAIAMKEKPIKKDGKLWGKFYILDTPCGRILKTLADFGYNIGISSRGTGDTFTDDEGIEEVDPDTYDFQCFDAVLLPAVKEARMHYVTESLDTSKQQKSLKEVINEELNKENDKNKKLMEDTLRDMKIDYNLSSKTEKDEQSKEVKEDNSNIKDTSVQDETKEATDSGTNELVKNLQEAIKSEAQLKAQVSKLQEELAVRDSKVNQLNEELSRFKTATIQLSDYAKDKKSKVKDLNESITSKDKTLKEQYMWNRRLKKHLKEALSSSNKSSQLNESYDSQIKQLNTKIESYAKALNDKDSVIKQLKEDLSKSSNVSMYKKELNESKSKLNESIKLQEKYKKIAIATADKYINLKANAIGVTTQEIKDKLGESYSLSDVDRVCEQMKQKQISLSKLPFNITSKPKVSINEEYVNKPSSPFDDIDDMTASLYNDYIGD